MLQERRAPPQRPPTNPAPPQWWPLPKKLRSTLPRSPRSHSQPNRSPRPPLRCSNRQSCRPRRLWIDPGRSPLQTRCSTPAPLRLTIPARWRRRPRRNPHSPAPVQLPLLMPIPNRWTPPRWLPGLGLGRWPRRPLQRPLRPNRGPRRRPAPPRSQLSCHWLGRGTRRRLRRPRRQPLRRRPRRGQRRHQSLCRCR